ncbi:MAG: hypothetical protein HZB19_08335 [Chloroflexi bacterium]|nr:hypothetical protein [Chloroflexota bacterium]
MVTKSYRSHVVFLVFAVVLLGITFLPLLSDERTLDAFVREDGVFEDLTVVYLLVMSFVFAAGFFRFRKSSILLKLSYLGFALLFFVGAGEEISWGERIFNWDDHNYIKGINVQDEITIHNLKYFQGDDAILPVSVSQLFTGFAFVFALIIPLVCRFFPKLERFLSPIFPVMPLYAGTLVAATYVFQKLAVRILPMFPELYLHPTMPIAKGVHEIREHDYTFALMVSAIFYFATKMEAQKVEDRREFLRELTSAHPSAPLGAKNASDET